jgi:hypothetical protein
VEVRVLFWAPPRLHHLRVFRHCWDGLLAPGGYEN